MLETLREDLPDLAIVLQSENKTYPGKQATSSILLVRTNNGWQSRYIFELLAFLHGVPLLAPQPNYTPLRSFLTEMGGQYMYVRSFVKDILEIFYVVRRFFRLFGLTPPDRWWWFVKPGLACSFYRKKCCSMFMFIYSLY